MGKTERVHLPYCYQKYSSGTISSRRWNITTNDLDWGYSWN